MDTINVNVKKSKISTPKRERKIMGLGEAETTINIGDNLFTLMLVGIAAFGAWAISAVFLL